MRTIPLILGLLLATAPSAAATGYLVNIGVGSFQTGVGANAFGGSGDTLDVGLFNTQCTDEADVVDVGIANSEGACERGVRCAHNEGRPLLPGLSPIGGGADPTPAQCSDNGDAVDVSLLNEEGSGSWYCDPTGCWFEGNGDAGDATDVSVFGMESGDHDDGNDVGVLNCENGDQSDATDVGLLNQEWQDEYDTLDLSLLNSEYPDNGDTNGLNVGGGSIGLHLDCRGLPVDGIGPVIG